MHLHSHIERLMEWSDRIASIVKQYTIQIPMRYWVALDTDYKSVVCALVILSLVLLLNNTWII